MSTLYSIGQMNQLGDALEAAGYTADDLTKMRSTSHLATFRNVLRGQVEIVVIKHTIDLDAKPFVPNGWKVEEHRQGGQFAWDPMRIALYLADQQKSGVIVGNELRKVLKDQPVLNANVLDYLLANPELIPEEWKGKYIFFWGTIYRDSDGVLYVRYLYWRGGQWGWRYSWLGGDWYGPCPAAVLAS